MIPKSTDEIDAALVELRKTHPGAAWMIEQLWADFEARQQMASAHRAQAIERRADREHEIPVMSNVGFNLTDPGRA